MPSHELHQISPHVYWLTPDGTTDRPILGVVAGERGTLAIDSGNSPAHARVLLGALAAAGLAAPTLVALTHWHWDHVFGGAALDVPTIAQHETRRRVAELARMDWSDAALDERVASGAEIAFCRDMIKAELPDRADLFIRPPEIGFGDALEIDLGGVTCRVVHVGGDHASDSVVAHVVEDRVLFLGDCYYPAIYAPARHYSAARFVPLLARLTEFDAEHYLASHHTEPLSRAFMLADAALARDAAETLRACGGDRAAAIAALERRRGPLDEDATELIDLLLAGESAGG